MTVRVVCFDWGGVILRICRSWEEGCRRAGVHVRARPDHPELASQRQRISMHHQRGRMDLEAFCIAIAGTTMGLFTPEDVRRVHAAWLIEEYPGMDRVVAELNATPGVRTALLSNTDHAHWITHMPGADGSPARFPTAGRLHHRHASHLLGHAKPDAEIFRAFEREVGARGREVLFFDDLEENVRAALAAGWRAERIDPDGATDEQARRFLSAHGVW